MIVNKRNGMEYTRNPHHQGPTIIGFGTYHYKYASGHEGDNLLIGFSPRKNAFSLNHLLKRHQDISI